MLSFSWFMARKHVRRVACTTRKRADDARAIKNSIQRTAAWFCFRALRHLDIAHTISFVPRLRKQNLACRRTNLFNKS
jgi:hypothetical protein